MAAPVKFRRTRTVRNIGGIRGLAVRVQGARETIDALAQLPVAAQRRVLRQGMAAAARPVVKAMKAGAKSASASSKRKEGVGTTSRAIISKVKTSKRDPSIAYAIVGARRGYAEFLTFDKSAGKANVMTIQTQRRIRKGGKSVIRRRDLKNLGPIARKARLDARSNSARKRVPSRYLHLFEKRGSSGGRFMDKASRQSANQSMVAFNRVFFAGINREFAKRAAK
jgi:hypothetical protein